MIGSRQRKLGSTIALLTLGGTAWLAAVTPGTPMSPLPSRLPTFTFRWHNDVYGGEVGTNPDDLRTNGFAINWRIIEPLVLSADWSNLTNRGGVKTPPARVDELTLGLSYMVLDRKSPGMEGSLSLGAGARIAGDLGGESLQNTWHEAVTFDDVDLPYEEDSTEAVFMSTWHWLASTRLPWHEADVALAKGTQLQLAIDGGLLYSDLETQIDLETRLVLAGTDGSTWIGVRSTARRGETQSRTANTIASFEEGNWLTFGASAGHIFFQGNVELENELSAGWFGWRSGYDRNEDWFGGDRLVAELGPVLGDFAIALSVRWQPYWIRDLADWTEHTTTYVGYGFGHVPGQDIEGASIRYQQLTVGLDHEMWKDSSDTVIFTPYFNFGAGYRQEEIAPEQEGLFIKRERHSGGVLELGGGARMYWGEEPVQGGIRYGLSFGYQHRFMTNEATVLDANRVERTFLESNGDVQLRLLTEIGW